jgi:ribA/ribD-fused uncharacterized protein
MTDERILLDRTDPCWRGLASLDSDHPVRLRRSRWPTAGHYFHAAKFFDEHHIEQIRAADVREARRLGQSRSVAIRDDWEDARVGVMLDVLRAKIRQHDLLAEQLLATGTTSLVKRDPQDAFWGDGSDRAGRNMYGHVLMRIRRELGRHRAGYATAMSWNVEPAPLLRARLPIESDEIDWGAHERLERGHIPGEMEDKSFAYLDGRQLFFHPRGAATCSSGSSSGELMSALSSTRPR